jgi:hypothetical protein
MAPDAASVCEVSVNRSGSSRWSRFEPCGMPIERDGKCKIHLRVDERRAAKDREYAEKRDCADALQREATTLSAALGIDVNAYFNPYAKGGGNYTGDFVVPGDWLRSQVKS